MVRKREKSEQTLAAILAAALELTSKNGLQNLTLGDIAKQLDISKSGVFVRVGSVEALQLLVVEECERIFLEAVLLPVVNEPPGLPQLDAIVRLWISSGSSTQALLGAHYAGQAIDEASPLNQRLKEGLLSWREQLEGLTGVAVRLGHLRSDTQPAQLVFEVTGLMLGLFYDARHAVDPQAETRAWLAYQRLMSTYRSFVS